MTEQQLLQHIFEALERLRQEERERHRHLMTILAAMLGVVLAFAWASL